MQTIQIKLGCEGDIHIGIFCVEFDVVVRSEATPNVQCREEVYFDVRCAEKVTHGQHCAGILRKVDGSIDLIEVELGVKSYYP